MANTIGAHMIIRNGDAYDFPWREGIRSVIDHVDEFVLLEAHSDLDNTYEECLKMAREYPKIRVIRGDWDGDEPEGHEYLRLSRLTNQCIEEVKSTWQWQVQGDEVWHEGEIQEVLDIMHLHPHVRAIMSPFHHFVGNFSTVFPFVYQGSFRMARRDSTWRADGDAWIMKFSDPQDNAVTYSHAHCYHYGFTGDLQKRVLKERKFQDLFKSKGFPDPRVVAMADRGAPASMAFLFQDAKDKGLFKPFTGTHPAVMKEWIENHRQYEEVFA